MLKVLSKFVISVVFLASLGSVGCGPSKGVEKGKDDSLKKIESGGAHGTPQEGGPKLNDKNALGGAGKKKN